MGKTVRGPLLVELNVEGGIEKWYFPAPADVLLVEVEDKEKVQSSQDVSQAKAEKQIKVQRYALAPLKPPHGAVTDLNDLALIGHTPHLKEKPYKKAPRYWSWETLQAWLINASDSSAPMLAESLGLEDLPREQRIHVSIEPTTLASLEGALFQTSGLEFTRPELNADKRVSKAHTLAMFFKTDATLNEGIAYLGGERRVVQLQKAQSAAPDCPEQVKQKILDHKHCRLILATPANFEEGYVPKFLKDNFDVKVSVQGIALARYQTISGWDYAKENGKGSPKPTRRLVPAGSVYFLKFEDNPSAADMEKFIDAVWLNAISDDEQSRRDGFGLALLGAWDGSVKEMEATL